MANIIKALGANTITITGTHDLYTVPASGSAIVNSIRLVNGTTAVTSALNLYVVPSGGTARRIHKKDFTLPASGSQILQDPVTLGQGDKVQLNIATGAAPTMGYMLNGIERS